MTIHQYDVKIRWIGNIGDGTKSYQSYTRDFLIENHNKPSICGSADPAYRGDPTKWNPEDLMVAAASACHKLWYLHLCAVNGVCIMDYVDHACGFMEDAHPEKRGHITHIILKPHVILQAKKSLDLAKQLHQQAHHECMIANSVNFPILCEPSFEVDK
ncbi:MULTISPECIES: OsmC family protein [unclassified Acinetobacter]|uniref:OsmC family protein n=1 Tax=unclassified Acinetobacter TaxID=196816 RepID=UPI00190D776C|nr:MULTISPECIES: OsmC family protein [unclassified Acinetobacter]MBK0064963.1 OsmC family protein [Acinetobacter sp. S55]MBK0067346.1 OsmC family protein [Acinetobacter sp. S54]